MATCYSSTNYKIMLDINLKLFSFSLGSKMKRPSENPNMQPCHKEPRVVYLEHDL